MRALFGLVGLVVVLAIVGLLAKKQLAATRAPVPALQPATGSAAPASEPTGTVREQSQQMQQQVKQQVKQQVEGLMQQARPMPEDEKK